MVREALQVTEVAIKLSALGIKNALALSLAYAKENPKVKGKTSLDRLLREGKELKIIALQSKDVGQFKELAKQYGVLFAVVKDKAQNEKVDVMFKAEDVAKLNRIYEQLGYAIPKVTTADRKKMCIRDRYEGCISVIDGFSQCEEDKTRIEYTVDAVMRIMPVGSEIWPEECEPLLKKIGAETIGDVADYLNNSKSENSSADDVLFTAFLKICYENMDMDGKMVFWEDMLENNSLEWSCLLYTSYPSDRL